MSITLTECPRDAMQGIEQWIPTEKKVEYLNQLLKTGFDVLDFGSFVSPKAIPQMRDTAKVLEGLTLNESDTKLLAIIANARGAKDACAFEQLSVLGYPFSISQTFQQRNTNASIDESLKRVEEIQSLCRAEDKQLLIYISMAFGNPYGDPWGSDLVASWIEKLSSELEINHFALADTLGNSDVDRVGELVKTAIGGFPELSIGVHLHSAPQNAGDKVLAAYENGARQFDSTINGIGGCPMADDYLVGNTPTEVVIDQLSQKEEFRIDKVEFRKAQMLAKEIFP